MMHLARKIDSNFDPDFFIARLHINISDKIQSLRQSSGSRLRVWLQMLRRCIPDREAFGAQVQLRFPAAD